MQETYHVSGTLTDSRTIQLDEPIPVSSGRVRVIVEVPASAGKLSHEEFLTWLQQLHEARGHVPRTREELDAFLLTQRASWDES
jgi:hypothetical protein